MGLNSRTTAPSFLPISSTRLPFSPITPWTLLRHLIGGHPRSCDMLRAARRNPTTDTSACLTPISAGTPVPQEGRASSDLNHGDAMLSQSWHIRVTAQPRPRQTDTGKLTQLFRKSVFQATYSLVQPSTVRAMLASHSKGMGN